MQLLQSRIVTVTEVTEERNAMRIAVACVGLDVSTQFEHCTNFTYYTVENYEIIECQNMPNLGQSCASTISMMKDLEVEVLVTGSIGDRCRALFSKNGIHVVTSANGNAREAAEHYLADAVAG